MNLIRRILGMLSLALRRLPVTTLLLLAAAALFSVRLALPLFDPSINSRNYYPGALSALSFVKAPEIRGYFQLWEGEWWRVLVSTMHHGSVLHLLMNSLFIWGCALMLEPRMGRLLYLLFVLSAAIASSLLEIAAGTEFVGLSGVGYALFGALLFLRRTDSSAARLISPQFVAVAFGWIFLCVPLTLLKWLPIANGAHIAGLVYGAVVGWLLFLVAPRRPWRATIVLSVVHGFLLIGMLAAMTPVRNASFVAWRASQSEGVAAQLLWHRATNLDPRQVTAWRNQIAISVQQRDWLAAWTLCLQASKANRTDETLITIARELWSELQSRSQSDRALAAFQSVFGDETDAWKRRVFGTNSQSQSVIDSTSGVSLPIDDQTLAPTLNVTIDVDQELIDFTRQPRRKGGGNVDPHDPRSALLGESL